MAEDVDSVEMVSDGDVHDVDRDDVNNSADISSSQPTLVLQPRRYRGTSVYLPKLLCKSRNVANYLGNGSMFSLLHFCSHISVSPPFFFIQNQRNEVLH